MTTLTAPPPVASIPSFGGQLQHLLKRRWTVFRRTPSDWLANAVMLLVFPLLAVMMMWQTKHHFAADTAASPEARAYGTSMAIFLQVLLVIAMSARNGAKEIAGERALFLREKLGGLRTYSYVVGKLLYLAPLFVAQGAWMSLFADMMTGGVPGNGAVRLGLLIAVAAAFTLLSLGISACSSSRNSASVSALLLVLAQVPLSGALLPLPSALGSLLHPLISAHAAWSGCLETLHPSDVIAAFDKINGTWLLPPTQAFTVLGVQALVGIVLVTAGLARRSN